ncbi:MAG: hypothetical protein M3R14_13440 [Acidobacteriota bacterium]|nr:hypothetical protein [Acidobacteriota bacterium]
MKNIFLSTIIFLSVFASLAHAQDEVLSDGLPPLTRRMTERITDYYAYILNVQFTDEQRKRVQKGLVDYWENQDFKAIGWLTVEDENTKQFFASPEAERQRVRKINQERWVKELREDKTDALSQFLVSVYDETRKNSVITCNPAETPSNSAPARLLKIGRYDGAATNETAGFVGKTSIDVKNIDSTTGKISAKIYFYAGLESEGNLMGTIGERGGLTLTGNLGEGKVCVQGKLTGNELAATYQTEESMPENGSFKIAFKGVATENPTSDKFPPLLIGKWRFDVYEPGQRLSNIGPNITTGYSKLFTIEFFDDGSYKYIETNRLCPTGRTCCRNNNQLEKGVFSITAAGFNFSFKSGDMMHTDECNPMQAAIAPMKTTNAHLLGMHKWAIGPTGERQVLTFCIEQGGRTICFERTK